MMNLRESWVNTPLLKNIIKRNLFPAKVSLLIYAGFFVLMLISAGSSLEQVCVLIFCLSAVILTTVYPCILQNYLVNKTKSALMRSIPLSTKCIWFTNYLAGYLIVLVTLLIEGLGIILTNGGYYLTNSSIESGRFILLIFVLLFIYYTLVFFVCSMAGSRLGQVIFALLGYVLPIIVVLSFHYISTYLIPGRVASIADGYFTLTMPLAAGVEYISIGNPMTLLFHLAITLVLLVCSYYIYKNRSDEYIGEPLVYRKMSIVLKAGIILIVTLCGFYLILLCGIMDISYGVKGILTLLLIYLIIGVIVTVFIGMIFKERYLYKKLLIYVPILIAFFGINYLFANYQYNRSVDNLLSESGLEGRLYISNEKTANFIGLEFDAKETIAFVNYLNDHRDGIHAYDKVRSNLTADMVNVSFSVDAVRFENIDGVEEKYYDGGITYHLEKEIVMAYLNRLDAAKKAELLTIDPTIKDEPYVNIFTNGIENYLLPDEIDLLLQMTSQQMKPEDLLKGNVIELRGNNKSYLLKVNQQVKDFLNQPELLKRSNFINKCSNHIYDDKFIDSKDEDNQMAKKVKEILKIDKFNEVYMEEQELVSFSDSLVNYQLGLSVVTDGDSFKVELTVELMEVNGEIVIKTVEGREVK